MAGENILPAQHVMLLPRDRSVLVWAETEKHKSGSTKTNVLINNGVPEKSMMCQEGHKMNDIPGTSIQFWKLGHDSNAENLSRLRKRREQRYCIPCKPRALSHWRCSCTAKVAVLQTAPEHCPALFKSAR
jgi:hypothetical protein